MALKDTLKRIPILSGLDEKELVRLESSLIRRQYTKGQTIFQRGDEGGTLYIIHKGRVSVFVPAPQGEGLHLATLSPGEILGELSFIDRKTRSATAQALEKTELLCLLREDFLSLLRSRFDLVLQFLEVIARRLRDTDALLAEKQFQGITSWLIKKILDLSRVFGIKKRIGP